MKTKLLLVLMVVSGFITTAQTTFNYTGAVQTFTVPAGITRISVDAAGAKGGDRSVTYVGGKGGRVQAYINVIPGEVLQIFVGGAGDTSKTAKNRPLQWRRECGASQFTWWYCRHRWR